MQMIVMYLSQLISYELCIWYPLVPSTLWRWMHWLCKTSKHSLLALQRRLIEAGADLMAQARKAMNCVNALKARLLIMQLGLNEVKGTLELAKQFLPNVPAWKALLPEYIEWKHPPQSLQYRIL